MIQQAQQQQIIALAALHGNKVRFHKDEYNTFDFFLYRKAKPEVLESFERAGLPLFEYEHEKDGGSYKFMRYHYGLSTTKNV